MKASRAMVAAGLVAAILGCFAGSANAGKFPTAVLNGNALKKQLPPSPTTPARELQCVVNPAMTITLPPLPLGAPNTITTPQQVVITNNIGVTIAAGTAYSYSFQGGHYLSTDHTKLAPGKTFTVGLGSNFHITSAVPCVASIPA